MDIFFKFFRFNAHGVDLNENFQNFFPKFDNSRHVEPETNAVAAWNSKFKFFLSGNLVSGNPGTSSVPFSNPDYSVLTFTRGSSTPDDDVFKFLASDLIAKNDSCPVSTYIKCGAL